MNYIGKLYGKISGRYLLFKIDAETVDKMEQALKEIANQKVMDFNVADDFFMTLSYRDVEGQMADLSNQGLNLLQKRRRPIRTTELRAKEKDYFWEKFEPTKTSGGD